MNKSPTISIFHLEVNCTTDQMPLLQQIHLIRSNYLPGANSWSMKPVLENIIDIGDFEIGPTKDLDGFNQKLLEILPGLKSHTCSGGFAHRLEDGTWMGHVLEHVVLEIQELACAPQILCGRTRQINENGIYYMIFSTQSEQIGREVLNISIRLVLSIVHNLPFDLNNELEKLKPWLRRYEIGPGTSKIIDAALQRRIAIIRPTRFNWFQLGYGCDGVQLWTSCSEKTSIISESIASDKQLVKDLLTRAFLHTPEGAVVSSYEEIIPYLDSLKRVTIKPLDSNRGHGVSLDLTEVETAQSAFNIAKKYSEKIIIEKYYPGTTYKFIIINNKIQAVIQGILSHLIGDGKHTIDHFIDQINKQREKGYGDWQPLHPIQRNEDLDVILKSQGVTLNTIVPQDKEIKLSFIFQGLKNVELELFHSDILRDIFTAHRVVGMDITGIDTIIEDISKPFGVNNGAIIEVNAGPSIFAYECPIIGNPKPIGAHILEYLKPIHSKNNFFLISIVGTKRFDQLIERLSSHLMACGEKTGIACEHGVYVEGKKIAAHRSLNLYESSRNLFMNRFLKAAIVEVDFPTLVNYGVPYAINTPQVTIILSIDSSCLLNLPLNNKVLNLETIFRTPVDLVPASGIVILNGDDPLIVELAKYAEKVCFVTTKKSIEHLNTFSNSQIFWYQNGQIKFIENKSETMLAPKYIPDSESALLELAFLAATRFHYNYRKQSID